MERFTGGLLVLSALTAFSFGAITGLATAEHYHVNCNNHGFVHGGSTNDSAYHGRVEGTPCGQVGSQCMVGQYNNVILEAFAAVRTTCNVFLSGYGPECAGFARVELWGVWSEHRHNAHNPC